MLRDIAGISREDEVNMWAGYVDAALDHCGDVSITELVAFGLHTIESQILDPAFLGRENKTAAEGTYSVQEAKMLGKIAFLRTRYPVLFPGDSEILR